MPHYPMRLFLFVSCFLLSVSCSSAPPQTAAIEPPLRVLIIGDSISIAYTPVVRKSLGAKAVVVRPTVGTSNKVENCAGTTKGVKAIDRWLALHGGNFDIIHFNFGLHDLKSVDPKTGRGSNSPSHPKQADLSTYVRQLNSIVQKLRATGATLVFATTTPVPTGGVRPHREPEDVEHYNKAAKAIMKRHSIAVNDLYNYALPQLASLQRPKNVHFTPSGSNALGQEVVKAVLKASHRRD